MYGFIFVYLFICGPYLYELGYMFVGTFLSFDLISPSTSCSSFLILILELCCVCNRPICDILNVDNYHLIITVLLFFTTINLFILVFHYSIQCVLLLFGCSFLFLNLCYVVCCFIWFYVYIYDTAVGVILYTHQHRCCNCY